MVAAANPMAVEAGLEVLRRGGSAVDAAVAVQMVLGVVEPQASGLGGGGFLLHYDGATRHHRRSMTAARRRRPAPRPRMFLSATASRCRFREAVASGLSVGVPGALAMLELAHKEHGKLAWSELFEPAIELARDGFAVPPRLADWLQQMPSLRDEPGAARDLLQCRRLAQEAGREGRQSGARRDDAADRRPGREGPLRRAHRAPRWWSACTAMCGPGTLSLADLAGYRPIKREPVCGPYRVWIVCGMPPPSSGGIAILQVLELLEPFELWRDQPNRPARAAPHRRGEPARLRRPRPLRRRSGLRAGARGRAALAGLYRRTPQADVGRPQHGHGRARPAAAAMSSTAPATSPSSIAGAMR